MAIVKHIALQRLEEFLNELTSVLNLADVEEDYILSTSESVIYKEHFANNIPTGTVSALRLDKEDGSRFVQFMWQESDNGIGNLIAWFMDEEQLQKDGLTETDHAWMNPEFNDRYRHVEMSFSMMARRMLLFLFYGHMHLDEGTVCKEMNDFIMKRLAKGKL